MTEREALQTLIFVAPISESDKARILALIPDMTSDEVRALAQKFAQQELALDARLTLVIDKADAFLKEYAE